MQTHEIYINSRQNPKEIMPRKLHDQKPSEDLELLLSSLLVILWREWVTLNASYGRVEPAESLVFYLLIDYLPISTTLQIVL